MKKLIAGFALAAVFTACSSAPVGNGADIFSVPKVNTGDTLVTVNGRPIRQGFLDVLANLSPRLSAQLANPLTRKKVLGSLVEQQLLYDEAMRRGLEADEQVLIKSLLNQHTIVSNTLLEKELDAAMLKAFEERKESQFTQISLSQIAFNFLTEDEIKKGVKTDDAHKQSAMEKAKAAKARLNKGEDFATVAKETSDDKRTASKGGQAGQVSRDDKRYARLGLQEVANGAFNLKKDQTSDIIETTTGYYIVKVTSDPKITDYEEAKRVLGFELQASVKTKLLEELKKTAKVEYADAKDAAKPADTAVTPESVKDKAGPETKPAQDPKDGK